MKRFFQQVLATTLGFFIAFALFIGLALSGIVWFSGHRAPTKLSGPAVLRIELGGELVEYAPKAPLSALYAQEQVIDLVALKAAIKHAQQDPHIKGIYLSVKPLVAGWASLAEIREALEAFKATGKFIIAYGTAYSQKTFYLASLADEIVVHPQGIFFFQGLSLTIKFYKGLLDKLAIKPQIFVAGQYKSALEPFVSNAMSKANKHQFEVLLGKLYDHLIDTIATARGLPPASVRRIANKLVLPSPQEAYEAQLVTMVGHFDDAEAWIRTKLGLAEGAAVNYVRLGDYAKATVRQARQSPKAKIAVLLASGSITEDATDSDSISSQAFVKHLRKLREDPAVKAIVLRINCRGGDVLACNTIWKELMLTRAHKPIVASLRDIAASGGYQLALACNYIISHPTTITGSIGVFSCYFTIDSFLRNKLGVTVDGVKTAPSADFPSITRPPSAHEKDILQRRADQYYANFIELVATSRQMSPEEAERVGGGRVWLGSLAQEHGLVDELGSLENAIEKAADLAALKGAYTVSYYPTAPASTWLEDVRSAWKNAQHKMLVGNTCNEMAPYLKSIQKLYAMRGIQERLPYDIEID